MARCEDYPCCGHTDGLGCNWTSPNEDPNLWYCNRYEHQDGGVWHSVGEPCWYDDRYFEDKEEE